MKFETEYIEKLAKIIADNELTEISLEDGEQAITIRKDVVVTCAPQLYSSVLQLTLFKLLLQHSSNQPKTEPAKKGKHLLLLLW